MYVILYYLLSMYVSLFTIMYFILANSFVAIFVTLSYGGYAQFLCVITKLLSFGNWIFKVFPPPQYSEIPSVKVRLIMR